MKKLLLSVIAILILTLATTKLVEAKEICTTQYGGGQTCENIDEDADLSIDKRVYNPDDSKFENHIELNDYVFTEGEEVEFQIVVKNTGDVTYKEVKLTDELPDFVTFKEFTGGKDGDYDNGIITWKFTDFKKGDSKTFKFKVEVVESSKLPKDSGDMQLTNVTRVEGTRKDNNEKDKNADFSRFYVRLPEVKGAITKLPEAGAVSNIFAGLLLITGFAIKVALNKKAISK